MRRRRLVKIAGSIASLATITGVAASDHSEGDPPEDPGNGEGRPDCIPPQDPGHGRPDCIPPENPGNGNSGNGNGGNGNGG